MTSKCGITTNVRQADTEQAKSAWIEPLLAHLSRHHKQHLYQAVMSIEHHCVVSLQRRECVKFRCSPWIDRAGME